MTSRFLQHSILPSLLCLVMATNIACKSENFGKTPGSSTSNLNTEETPAPKLEEPSQVIPRIEYPGDQSNFGKFEVGEEASIATDVTGTYLSIPKGILEVGTAIAIRISEKVLDSAVQSLKIVIPKKTLTTDDNLVVIYRMSSQTGENYYGVIPKKDLEVRENSVAFQPKGLGVYQAATTPIFIGEGRQVPILGTANGPRLALVTTYDTPGLANDIHIQNGSTAYVADGNGLEVLNWSQASGFTPNTRLASPANLSTIHGVGNRLYLTAGASGVGTVDVSQSLSLQLVDSRGVTNGIAVSGNLRNMYISQERSVDAQSLPGITRFDIQQNLPRYEVTGNVGGDQAPQNTFAIQIQGLVAFALSRTGLYSFDITQNDRINPLGVLALNGTAERLCLSSNRAYVIEKSTGVSAVDILDPVAPKILSQLSLPQAIDLVVKDRYLIVVDSYRKVKLIDIGDPSHMLVLHELTISGMPTKVRVFGDFIFVTMGDTGVAVLNIVLPSGT